MSAIANALRPPKRGGDRKHVIKTLIDSFRYPRLGPGMMWEAAARKIEAGGGAVLLDQNVVGAEWSARDGTWTVTTRDASGEQRQFTAAHVVSTTSIQELVPGLTPPPSPALRQAASKLRFREFLVVALVVKDRGRFDDNWIYIHDPTVKVGRIQNFKSWSPEMVPDPALNCYGMEYFCFEGDEVWASADADLVNLARSELVKLGLASADEVIEGHVVRQPKAYPVYDEFYEAHVATVRGELAANYPNMHLVGRNGMHRYNNQDHAMMTAMLTVRNIMAGQELYDVWRVNQDAEYHEAGSAGDQTEISTVTPAAASHASRAARIASGI